MGGIRFNTNYPGDSLADYSHRTRTASQLCAPSRTAMNAADGDETGDINDFWAARDYTPERRQGQGRRSSRRTACRTTTCRLDQFAKWWAGLTAQQRPAQAVADAHGPRRPVRLPPRRVGRHAAPLVRPLARRASTTGSWTEPQVDIETARDTLDDVRRLARPGHGQRRRVPARHDAGRGRRARRSAPAATPTR